MRVQTNTGLVLCYAIPLLLLGLVYLGIGEGTAIFFRNWLRAACGPAVRMASSPNDLATFAVAFGLIWPVWLTAVFWTPLRRLRLAVHATGGSLWCLAGFWMTLAI